MPKLNTKYQFYLDKLKELNLGDLDKVGIKITII